MTYPMNEAMRHAATLMAEQRWTEAVAAYETICRQQPEHAAMAASQVGAAHFFLRSYALAIQWYEYAASLGFDARMTADNIAEAQTALRASAPRSGDPPAQPEASSAKLGMPLSFVLLPRPYDASGAHIVDAHSRLFPAAPRPLASISADGKIAELRHHDGLTTFVSLMPAPIPNGEAEAAAQYSMAAHSPQFGPLPPHNAHLLVTSTCAPDGSSRQDVLLRHSRVVAAAATAYGASAVYEGNARATHPTPFYVDAIATEASLVVWTGVSLASDGGRTSILTLGAQNMLGVPDIMVTCARGGGNDALGFALDMLGYVLHRGAPLPDGDTVGRTAEEKVRVQYVASPVDPARRVVKLDLP